MEEKDSLDLRSLLGIAARRKWLIILPLVIAAAGAVGLSYVMPPVYKSSTLIMVEAQKVPTDYVKPTVTTKVEDRLRTITQEIMSRTRLEAVIREFSLYADSRGRKTSEELVEDMRKEIKVQVRGNDSFTVEYEGTDPKRVQLVTARLASLFIEENLRVREQQAVSTSDFLDNELRNQKQILEAQERAVEEFKLRHMGELPEQRDPNLRTIDRLTTQLQTAETNLRNLQDKEVLLEGQIAERTSLLASIPAVALAPAAGPQGLVPRVVNPLENQINALNNQLTALLAANYTDKYPDVVRLRREIADLKARMAPQAPQEPKEEVSQPPPTTQRAEARRPEVQDTILQNMKQQSDSARLEVKNLKVDRLNLINHIRVLQAKVDNTPRREQQLRVLTRDYNNTLENYRTLLDKRLNAQIAENMERRQKGEQFKVLDPANLPEKPFKPNRGRIILVGVFLGLVLGGGIAYLRESLDPSLKFEDDVRAVTALPVLAVIPRLPDLEGGEKSPKLRSLKRMIPAGRRTQG